MKLLTERCFISLLKIVYSTRKFLFYRRKKLVKDYSVVITLLFLCSMYTNHYWY